MILAVDVHYNDPGAVAAGVLFNDWPDERPVSEWTTRIPRVRPYTPGRFYEREAPCILDLLKKIAPLPRTIIVDGHVYLGEDRKKGLGRHLYDALQGKVIVIGVAKAPFKNTPPSVELLRGRSKRPLYVTAAGVSDETAGEFITRMHGNNRMPTLLKRVDQLCRRAAGSLKDSKRPFPPQKK